MRSNPILMGMTTLILIGGLAAAGKTTLGQEMARITKFAYLDKDTITQPLVEALLSALDAPGGADDRQSDVYLKQVRPYEYQAFMNTVLENVTIGVPTIAVAPFVREMADPMWLDVLQQQIPDATIHKLWLSPSEDLLYERIVGRGSARDNQKLNDWTAHIESCRKIKPHDSCLVIRPNANEDAEDLATRVLEEMKVI